MHPPVARWLRRFTCAAGFAALAASAHAAPISCPEDGKCNGNSYTATYTNVADNTWQVQVDINVLSSYSGTLNSDRLSALAIKPATDVTNVSLLSHPGGYSLLLNELNANGCQGGDSGSLCAAAGTGNGVSFDAGDTLSFVFQFDTASIGDSIHLKYLYLGWDQKKKKWSKVGDLGSFDIPLLAACTNSNCEPDPCTNGNCEPPDPCTDGNCSSVPLPASPALMGIGLVAFGFARRLRRVLR